jgi:4-cresol dehydrogenase (hydroxylating)
VAAVKRDYALQLKLSVFGDGRALITIHFRSDDAQQVQRAQKCEAALWQALAQAGFPPYRVSIDQMQRLFALQPEFFELVAQIKAAFDPSGILAPGRYSPLSGGS